MKRSAKLLNETQKYALAGVAFGLLFPILAAAIRIVSANLPFNLSSIIAVHGDDPLLWIIDTAPLFLGFFAALAGRRQDQVRELIQQLRQRESDLLLQQQELEKHVDERTSRLTRKTEQLRSASYIARQTAEIQDLSAILNNVANLVMDQFGFYHTGIFLINETGDQAVLQAASSEGGRRMIESGHALAVGTQGIVGYVAAHKKSRIALDVGTDAVFFNNPYLPMTRSEAAIPLVIRNKVLGVLDIQSDKPQAFTLEDLDVLETLSDQVAIAIENAKLLDESQATLIQLEALSAVRTREAWSQKLSSRHRVFTYTPLGLRAEKPSQPASNSVEIPFMLRGQRIGKISIARRGDEIINKVEEEIITEVANQAGLAIDNIRLLEDATQRAKQEQVVGRLASRFSQSLNIDSLLQTAARELGQLPDVAEVSVFIGDESSEAPSKPKSKRKPE
jgi:GAF domain-containing protein